MHIRHLEYIFSTDKVVPVDVCQFLNQAHTAFGHARAWFLEIALVRVSVCMCVCVCVCLPLRPLITSGVIWCGIDRVRLVKQVLRLFPAFNYFIQHLPSIKWMGMVISTKHVVNACQGDTVLATKGLPERRSTSFIKVSGRMRNNAFKRRLAFSFTVIISVTFYY